MKRYFHLTLIAFLIISSCEQTSQNVSALKVVEDNEPFIQPPNDKKQVKGATLTTAVDHKLIKTVKMQLKVESVENDRGRS